MAETTQAGHPTVRRMALGARLKGHRERLGFTVDAVGRELSRTSRTVLRWEAGQVDIGEMLDPVMDMYRLDPEERALLHALTGEASVPGWWVPYSEVIRPTYQRFMQLEAEASGLDEYAAKLVPGLLQTADYMRAIMRSDQPPLSADVIRQRMLVRQKRQAEWDARQIPTRYLIDEAVLYRVIGNRPTMAQQLTALSEAAQRPNLLLRICSFRKGAVANTLGSVAIMSFDVMPPVAVVEGLTGDLYADRAEAEKYTRLFRALSQGAESEADSLRMIEAARGRLK